MAIHTCMALQACIASKCLMHTHTHTHVHVGLKILWGTGVGLYMKVSLYMYMHSCMCVHGHTLYMYGGRHCRNEGMKVVGVAYAHYVYCGRKCLPSSLLLIAQHLCRASRAPAACEFRERQLAADEGTHGSGGGVSAGIYGQCHCCVTVGRCGGTCLGYQVSVGCTNNASGICGTVYNTLYIPHVAPLCKLVCGCTSTERHCIHHTAVIR